MNAEKIYRAIAKRHTVSVEDVKREIELAVKEAWSDSDKTVKNLEMQRRISTDGSIPKVEDVVKFADKESLLK